MRNTTLIVIGIGIMVMAFYNNPTISTTKMEFVGKATLGLIGFTLLFIGWQYERIKKLFSKNK